MSFYPPKVQTRFHSIQKNAEAIDGASAIGRAVSFECGSFVEFEIKVEAGSKTIERVRFRSNGCGFMVAAADVLAVLVDGRDLADLHGLDREGLIERIVVELGAPPDERKQCFDVCIDALHSTFADLRERRVEEFRGEKAPICSCFGVSEETIEMNIQAKSLRTVDEVTEICNAGGGCGSCRMLIQEILDDVAPTDPTGGRML